MGISASAGIAIDLLFVFIALFFVVGRLYVKLWWQRSPSWSDGAIVLAWLLYTELMMGNLYNYKQGFWGGPISLSEFDFKGGELVTDDKHILTTFLKLFFGGGPVYYTSLWLIKANFILLYYKLVTPQLKIWLHLITGFIITSYFIIMGFNIGYCLPVSRNWTLDKSSFCLAYCNIWVYYGTLTLHLLSDFMVYGFPFTIIQLVRMPLKKKIGMGVMFALGLISILCSVGRAVSINTSFNLTPMGTWTSVELSSGIAVGCLPAFKWLWQQRKERKRTGLTRLDETIITLEGVPTLESRSGRQSVIKVAESWMMKKTAANEKERFGSIAELSPVATRNQRFDSEEIGSVGRNYSHNDL